MKKAFALGLLFGFLLFLVAITKMTVLLALVCAIVGGTILGGGISLYNAQHKKGL